MGVGTNVQDRAIALHHLDAPWRPADVAQRDGRILRQGNLNSQVEIVRYVTEKSFDGYMWQTLERKARFIGQVMHGRLDTREIADIGDTALSFSEVKAIATGNPLLIDKAEADAALSRLQRAERAHLRNQDALRHAIGEFEAEINRLTVLADPVGLVTRLENRLTQLETRKASAFADIEHARRQITHARNSIGQPFPHAGGLAAAQERVREIDEALDRMAQQDPGRAREPGRETGGPGSGGSVRSSPTAARAHEADKAHTRTDRHVPARDEHEPAAAAPSPDDNRRMQANRAAVAANKAYRAGDLDQALQLIDQAAAFDPSRARLWQQHRQQITARRMILDARAAHAPGDRRRAEEFLGEARQLDPSMPAIWDGGLPVVPSTGPDHRDNDKTAPEQRGTANTIRASHAPDPRHRAPVATAAGNGPNPQPSWPSSPARREPSRSVPASPQAHEPKPMAQCLAAAVSREPQTGAEATADNPDADATTPGTDPSAWPAPNPRIRQEDTFPTREAGHKTGTATEADASIRNSGARNASPSVDWRDGIMTAAREPWQSGPRWPDNPALYRSPDARSLELGIEASE
jgi:tetratricopeptide (TPR) repeat protein